MRLALLVILAGLPAASAGARRPPAPRKSPPPSASALAREGEAHMAKGEIPQAIELLSRSVTLDPNDPLALAELTLAYLRHGDLEFAQFYLDLARRSLAAGSGDSRIYEVLGDVYRSRNQVEEAVDSWEEAWKLGDHTPALRGKIERAQTEWAYAHDQRYYGSDGCEVFYDDAVGEETARKAAEFVGQEAAVLAGVFDTELPARPIVILYAGRRYFALMDTPDWVGGFYDGRIHLPASPEGMESEEMRALLRHELAHAFIARVSRGRAPLWLQEGLARLVEGQRADGAELDRAARVLPVDSLSDLSRAFAQRIDRARAGAAYSLALGFIQQLASRRGIGAVVCAAADFGRGDEPAVARDLAGAPGELFLAWRSGAAAGMR